MQDSRIFNTCYSVCSSILTGNHGLLNHVNLVDLTNPLDLIDLMNFEDSDEKLDPWTTQQFGLIAVDLELELE